MKQFLDKIIYKNNCWLWTGATNKGGYALIYRDNKTQLAHRAIYKLIFGDIPDGMQLDHLCRNRNCIKPAHLEVVTPKENTMRGIGLASINSKKTECLRGHSLAGCYISKNGKRHCRYCNQIRKKQYRLARAI